MANNKFEHIKILFKNRIFLHILFWLLSFYILLNLFSDSSEISKVDYIYTAIFLVSIVLAVYLNLFILVPTLLKPRKFIIYSVSLLVVLAIGALFNLILFNKLIDFMLPGYYFISYYSYFDILKFFIVFLTVTTLLKLSKEWFQLVETENKLNRIEKEKVEIELKGLRSQVNPHFLFNSLNVIYSLVLKESNEAPETITKLSDILRYVLYDSNSNKVKISSEIELINNYINIQKHRVDSSSKIEFTNNIKNDIEIPPLLFLPLVENSFKHGVKGDISNTFVTINLSEVGNEIIFEIENNKGFDSKVEGVPNGGIGINNIKQRLELLMPDNYTLDIFDNKNTFKVILKLKYDN